MQLGRLTTRVVNGIARRYPPLQRRLDRRDRRRYIKSGRTPMSPGYEKYKDDLIARVLNDARALQVFRSGSPLPEGYGVGIDERCVEYPWLFSRLHRGEERLLDAGSVLNHWFLVEYTLLANKKLHVLTLAPEHAAFWKLGISYLYEDMRAIPIKDDFYDEIVCLSTLEHVGLDASFWTGRSKDEEERPDDFKDALLELRRVLKPGGTMYLSVPFGVYRNIGVLQVFDEALLERAIHVFGAEEVENTFYRYTPRGWKVSTVQACADAEYVQAYFRYYMTPEGERPKVMPKEDDLAAAARAVACVRLRLGSKDGQSRA